LTAEHIVFDPAKKQISYVFTGSKVTKIIGGRHFDEKSHRKRLHSSLAHPGFGNLDGIGIHAIRVRQ
jgi:hypothetical protein